MGLSFWAMWYKALIAFILNSGGFLSAAERAQSRDFHLIHVCIQTRTHSEESDCRSYPARCWWCPATRRPPCRHTGPHPWPGSPREPSWQRTHSRRQRYRRLKSLSYCSVSRLHHYRFLPLHPFSQAESTVWHNTGGTQGGNMGAVSWWSNVESRQWNFIYS